MAAAQLQVVGTLSAAGQAPVHPAQQACERHVRRGLLPIVAGDILDIRDIPAGPGPHATPSSTSSASKIASAASRARRTRAWDPGVPAQPGRRCRVGPQRQRLHRIPGQHRIDREPDFESHERAHQANQRSQPGTVGQQGLERRQIEGRCAARSVPEGPRPECRARRRLPVGRRCRDGVHAPGGCAGRSAGQASHRRTARP